MEVLKTIVWTTIILAMLVAGSVAGVILAPIATIVVIYFINATNTS